MTNQLTVLLNGREIGTLSYQGAICRLPEPSGDGKSIHFPPVEKRGKVIRPDFPAGRRSAGIFPSRWMATCASLLYGHGRWSIIAQGENGSGRDGAQGRGCGELMTGFIGVGHGGQRG
jgi:hypothetical protein